MDEVRFIMLFLSRRFCALLEACCSPNFVVNTKIAFLEEALVPVAVSCAVHDLSSLFVAQALLAVFASV